MSTNLIPPSDLDAEAAVLSAILLAPESFDRVQELLQPEHFYADANRQIYQAMVELQTTGRPTDIVSVSGCLRDRQCLQQIGGTPYLAQLSDATPAVAHIEAHAKVVREKWRVRQLIVTCQRFAAEGYGDYGEVQDFIDHAEQAVFDIARIPENSTISPLRDAVGVAFKTLADAAARGDGITGIESGLKMFDKQCSGLHDGDLYIVAARPGMGKTSLALNIAINVSRPSGDERGYGVLFCSLEMPREQLAARVLSSEARVDMQKVRSGRMQREDWNKLTDTAKELSQLPLWLDDTPALTLLDLRAKIRRLQADIARGAADGLPAKKLGLVVVDYLQLMQGRRGAGSREQEISELSRGLKGIAKEMKVPVMALSQLNRAVETRSAKDKRPQLSDLRESGAIEQDADTIIFVYRDEYYFRDSEDKGVAELIVAKQRNGPTGKVMVKFTSEYTRFDNLAADEYQFDDFGENGSTGAWGAQDN
jgi:replicative DNA helicase